MVDAASVCLAAGWVCMWGLWPDADVPANTARWASGGRASYVRMEPGESSLYTDPTVFGRRSSVGFGQLVEGDDRPSPDLLSSLRATRAKYLEVSPSGDDGRTGWGPSDATLRAAPSARRWAWAMPNAFSTNRVPAPRFVMDASPELRGRGFDATAAREPIEGLSENAWAAVVYVQFGADGTVEHVFLESAPEDSALGGQIVRAMYRATVGVAGPPVGGRVTVSHGGG